MVEQSGRGMKPNETSKGPSTGAQKLSEAFGQHLSSFYGSSRYDGVYESDELNKRGELAEKFTREVLRNPDITRQDLVGLLVEKAVDTSLGAAVRRNGGRIDGTGGMNCR